jgi:hypothetical protein
MVRVEVTARTNSLGNVLPICFTWKDREHQILGIGRRWQDEDGEHFLIMIPGDRVVELIYSFDQTWSIKSFPEQGKRWFS